MKESCIAEQWSVTLITGLAKTAPTRKVWGESYIEAAEHALGGFIEAGNEINEQSILVITLICSGDRHVSHVLRVMPQHHWVIG